MINKRSPPGAVFEDAIRLSGVADAWLKEVAAHLRAEGYDTIPVTFVVDFAREYTASLRWALAVALAETPPPPVVTRDAEKEIAYVRTTDP